MKRFHWLLLVALLSALPSVAQTSATEPVSLLIKAYQQNTIASITGPYHLLATFETYAPDGKPAGSGSIERWSIAPTRQKTVTHFRNHTMTDYFVDGKHQYTDDGFDGTIMLYRVYQSVFNSMPLPRGWERQQLQYKSMPSEDATVDCTLYQLSLEEPPSSLPLQQAICLSQESHHLTLTQGQQLSTQYTGYAPFQDKSIPRTISIAAESMPRGSVHLQQLDETMLADAAMLPPADASPVSPGPEWLDISRDEGRPRYRVEPAYTRQRKSDRIEEPVAVLILRSRSGTIKDIEPIEGDRPEIVQIVIDAVKNWTYAPLIREDKPVETISAVSFNFTARK